MLDFIYKDKDGSKCLAKTAITTTLFTCLGTIIYQAYSGASIDYSGMATLIGAVGAIYWGRSNTKAVNNAKFDK